MLRILIAPDKFKGSLTSREVCGCIEKGLRHSLPDAEILSFPLADGGEGLLDSISCYHQGPLETQVTLVEDPLGRPVHARWLLSKEDRTAYIEMAAASGLQLLLPSEYNCLATSTFGTGQLILAAVQHGVRDIVLGIGGSATNDGGMGMAAALGYRFSDKSGTLLTPSGGNLIRIDQILAPGKKEWASIAIHVICDVRNPLCGPQGATHTYAAQKGADAAMIRELEEGMQHYAEVLKRDLRADIAEREGAGAAGGLGAGCLAYLQARLVRGVEWLIHYSGLAQRIAECDVVITGEGKMDRQTLQGKLVAGLAALGRKYDKPVLAVCGDLELSVDEYRELGIKAVFPLMDEKISKATAIQDAAALLEERAKVIGRWLLTADS